MSQISNNLVFMQKNRPILKIFAILLSFFFLISVFAMLESTESASHSMWSSVGAIKNIWFYWKFLISKSFSAFMFETHNLFSLVFVLVVMMICSICHMTFTTIKGLFSKLLARNFDNADSNITYPTFWHLH